MADLKLRPNCFWAYDPGDDYETLASAAKRLIDAGFTARSHRLRCYVLIGFPAAVSTDGNDDTLDAADKRLRDMLSLGFTPHAMLFRPEDVEHEKWEPPADWRALQRQWARPAIIHTQNKYGSPP